MRNPLSRRATWALVSAGAAMIASQVVDRSLDAGYLAVRGKRAPFDPRRRKVGWPETILWTVGSAAAIGIAELVARRGAASGWKRVTGRRPPTR